MGDRLHAGEKLERGQSLTSRNGAYRLDLQGDGNLVLYAGDTAVWSTETNGQDVVRAEVQKDGNFVLYTPDKPVWHTDTKGAKDVRLILQDDRNVVLYGFDGVAWASGTDTTERPPAGESVPAPAAADSAEPPAVAAEPEVELAAAEEPAPTPEPAAPAAPPPPPPPPAPRSYTVVSGDTLWAIAERFYGDGNQYPRIAEASGVANPDLIHPGQVLTIP
ncbi:LysM peptidoglycan-binding domain-containing protein [Mycobacterium sp. C31M]